MSTFTAAQTAEVVAFLAATNPQDYLSDQLVHGWDMSIEGGLFYRKNNVEGLTFEGNTVTLRGLTFANWENTGDGIDSGFALTPADVDRLRQRVTAFLSTDGASEFVEGQLENALMAASSMGYEDDLAKAPDTVKQAVNLPQPEFRTVARTFVLTPVTENREIYNPKFPDEGTEFIQADVTHFTADLTLTLELGEAGYGG